MADSNENKSSDQIEDILDATQKALDLQAEASTKTPKDVDGIVKKAKQENSDPEKLSGSTLGQVAEETPKTSEELLERLTTTPKPHDDPQDMYLKLADVPAVPATNVAAASLSGVDKPVDLQKSNIIGIEDSLQELPPGNAHLNPIPKQNNVVDLPGYKTRLPGSTRLNPVKVIGNPPSVIDCPYKSGLKKGHVNIQSVNVPGAGVAIPVITNCIASLSLPPLADLGVQKTLVNIPGSLNIPPGPASVARTGTDPHMNPVKLQGAPLVINTPVAIKPVSFIHVVESGVSATDPNTGTIDVIEHFTLHPDDIIEHFTPHPDDDSNDNNDENNDKSNNDNDDSNNDKSNDDELRNSSNNKPIASDENKINTIATDVIGNHSNITQSNQSSDSGIKTYETLSNVQNVSVSNIDVKQVDAQTVYKDLSNVSLQTQYPSSYVNAPQVRNVHLNPVKNPGTPPSVLETSTPQVVSPLAHTNTPVSSVCVPPGQHVVKGTSGNVHLNPVKTPVPNVINTPPVVNDNVTTTTPMNSINVPGQTITIPMQVQNTTSSVNVPPVTNDIQTVGTAVSSQNVPGVPILNQNKSI